MALGLLIAAALAAEPGPQAPPPAPEPTPRAARLAEAPAGAQGVIRYDPVYFTSFAPNTAMDMIVRLPGFAFDAGPQVRGFAGAAGNVLVDGDRPTSKQDNLQDILTRIPASQVDHIDVIRGGAPGVDMQGRTVLANVVRRKGAGSTTVIALANTFVYDGRLLPDGRFEYSRKWSGKSLELSLVPSLFWDDGAGDGPRYRIDPNGNVLQLAQVNTHAGGRQVAATAAYETPWLGGKFRINTSGLYWGYHNDEHDQQSTPAALSLLRDRQDKLQGELDLHFDTAIGRTTTLEMLAIQELTRRHFNSALAATPDSALFREADLNGETIGRAILRWRPSEKFSAELSGEGAYNVQTSDSAFDQNGAPVVLPAAHVKVTETRGEAAGTATWRPSSKVTLETGVRAEVSKIGSSGDAVLSKTLFYPKPRAILTLAPDPRTQIRLRVEREVGQLNFNDFVASSALGAGGVVRAGNPDLVPQDAWVIEAAWEKHIGQVVGVVTLRRQWISNVEDRIPVFSTSGDVFDAPGNIGSARETDLDLNLTVPLGAIIRHAQVKATGTYRKSTVTDPTTGEARRISGQHPFDYEVHFTHDIPRWRLTWGIDVFNRWTETYYRFNEIDLYSLKTYLGGFIEYKPRPGWSLRVEGDNLASRGLERKLRVYTGPRNTNPLQYIDDRNLDVGPSLRFRVRHTLS